MYWDDIAGHAGPLKILKNMLAAGRIPHALLFTGPAGLGKMLVARLLAAGLLCGAEGPKKPCGGCFSCRQVGRGGHPDLMVLANDGGSLKIDQIRALQQEAALVPYHGGKRVFIVEEAGRLTAQAANSLLKILEEPPASAVFVLTAASPYALLPTIVSRCWLLPFSPLSGPELTGFLRARGADPVKASAAARLSGGRIGAALALLAPDGFAVRDRALEVVAALPELDAALAGETTAALDKLEPAGLQALLLNIGYVLRDLFVLLAGRDDLLFCSDAVSGLQALAPDWDGDRLRRALDDVKQAARALEANANTRLVCEALLIKLSAAAKEGNDVYRCRRTV